MKKLIVLTVVTAVLISAAACAKEAPKSKAVVATPNAKMAQCASQCATPNAKLVLFSDKKEKKEFAKSCKYICEKCGYYDKKGGMCATCNVTMTKCKDVDACKKMVMTKDFERNCQYYCKKCGTHADKAGKCPQCGKKMKKCDAKALEGCKKAAGLE